jgi:hypothetical protein
MFLNFLLVVRTDLSTSLRIRTNMLANMRMAASGVPYIKFTLTMRCPAGYVCLMLPFLSCCRKSTAYCQGNITLVTDEYIVTEY